MPAAVLVRSVWVWVSVLVLVWVLVMIFGRSSHGSLTRRSGSDQAFGSDRGRSRRCEERLDVADVPVGDVLEGQ